MHNGREEGQEWRIRERIKEWKERESEREKLMVARMYLEKGK